MKIYIVESNVEDLIIYTTRSSAEKMFERIKSYIMIKYYHESWSDVESSNDEFYLHNPCEDECYEGQTYYVKLHEKEIKE